MSKPFVIALLAIAGTLAIFFSAKAYLDHQTHVKAKDQEEFLVERNERMTEQAKILTSLFHNCGFINIGPDGPKAWISEIRVAVIVDDTWKNCWTDNATAKLEAVLQTRTFGFKERDYLKVIEKSTGKVLLEYSIQGMKDYMKQT